MIPTLFYALLWLSFGAAHTLLASPPGRRWLELVAGPAHRLVYNLLASVHLGVVLGAGWRLLHGFPAFTLPAVVRPLLALIFLAGLVILAVAGRSYDLARFAGFAQLRRWVPDSALATEGLATGGMNARVRHPLYLGVLLMLWGGSTTLFALATAVCGTVYILVGIRFEEDKLLRLYGDSYTAYRKHVPKLLPWPGGHPKRQGNHLL